MLYKKAGAAWQVAQNITSLDFKQEGRTGFSVDLDSNVLAFGAPFVGDNAGAAYIYEWNPATNAWVKKTKRQGGSKTLFAYSVSVSKGHVAAGAPNMEWPNRGTVSVFGKAADSTWHDNYTIEPLAIHDERGRPFFGSAVSLDGDNLLVGANGSQLFDDGLSSTNTYGYLPGRAVLYKLRYVNNMAYFSQRRVLEAEFSATENDYAIALGISGNSFLIGHREHLNDSGVFAGAVVFGALD